MRVKFVLEMSDPPTDADDWERLREELMSAASSVLCDINRGDSGDVNVTLEAEV